MGTWGATMFGKAKSQGFSNFVKELMFLKMIVF